MERWNDGLTPGQSEDRTKNPDALDYIERISWFERQKPMTADNDNAPKGLGGSSCFESWAMPDFLRK